MWTPHPVPLLTASANRRCLACRVPRSLRSRFALQRRFVLLSVAAAHRTIFFVSSLALVQPLNTPTPSLFLLRCGVSLGESPRRWMRSGRFSPASSPPFSPSDPRDSAVSRGTGSSFSGPVRSPDSWEFRFSEFRSSVLHLLPVTVSEAEVSVPYAFPPTEPKFSPIPFTSAFRPKSPPQ